MGRDLFMCNKVMTQFIPALKDGVFLLRTDKNDFSFILSGIPKYDTIGGAYVSKGFFEALLQSTGRVNVETTFKILGVTGSKYVNSNHTHDTHSIFFQTKW